jgi:hypothetical protein
MTLLRLDSSLCWVVCFVDLALVALGEGVCVWCVCVCVSIEGRVCG